MRKIIFTHILAGALLLSVSLPFVAVAQSPAGKVSPPCDSTKVVCNPLRVSTIDQFISEILDIVVNIGTIVAVFFLIYAGFLFVTAQGNDQKLEKAKTAFLWTVIGIAVLLGAKVISEIISGTIKNLK